MKKNFKAVYVFEGEEYVIKTPVSLAKMLELYENVTGDFYTEPSADLHDELDSSYTYMADSVVELFVEDTGLVGDFEANFLLPSKEDEYGFRVVITRLEESNYSYDEEDNTIPRKEIIIVKNDKGNNIIHFKSPTQYVGKEPGIEHYLSDDEKVKNSLIGLTDDSIRYLYAMLGEYITKI